MVHLLRRVKRTIQHLIARFVFGGVPKHNDVACYGSTYGRWCVLPQFIDKHSVVYSFGVGEDITFDLALIDVFGVVVHAFDPTPRALAYVREVRVPDSFIMHPYGVAAETGTLNLAAPKDPAHASYTYVVGDTSTEDFRTYPVKAITDILTALGHKTVDILKMDIEGTEYEVIDALLVSPIRPKQLMVEFHHRFSSVSLQDTKRTILRLEESGYRRYWMSYSGQEFGFAYEQTHR